MIKILSVLLMCILVGCENSSPVEKTQLPDGTYLFDERISQKTVIHNEPFNSGSGSQQFLWKPVSERDGKLVVLTPAKYPNGKLTVNNKPGTFFSRANGNRAHYRFSAPGSSFGSNIEVVLYDNNRVLAYWIVPNGGQRYTQ